ncbi:hypothetical protein K437DRAFT_295136 [Tilletiaria anomala UBC 951]|uniref:BIR-domain-containing protein n=1 Tax=Tilletiaria anomala (strain ATCC 24038 / CBS 436.72 / UBC 951) TaxID=1037660 RepID=A0A066VY22_TILAU|nr:uncharacterized protein K437DRAFT_295136 [Tilletiaria anomala UBC 951]KDN43425.1 hypothetical protein K437DRAFT_295136 [Tilletiaria anomala UBC 951]
MPAVKSGSATFNVPATYEAAMASEEARRESFQRSAPHRWPHLVNTSKTKSQAPPYPSPEALARVGLFFTPEEIASSSKGAPSPGKDACTHYICGTRVLDWQPGDDPLERLRQLNPNCPSVLLVESRDKQVNAGQWRSIAAAAAVATPLVPTRGKRALGSARKGDTELPAAFWPDPRLLPTSDTMVEARRLTFGAGWPYDRKKGWGPTSAKIAAAGLHFEPCEDGEDNTLCVYCGRTLGGWEKGDDPVEEHLRGAKDTPCPFFSCKYVPPDKLDGLRAHVSQEEGKEDVEEVEEVEGEGARGRDENVAVEDAATESASTRTGRGRSRRDASTISAAVSSESSSRGQERSASSRRTTTQTALRREAVVANSAAEEHEEYSNAQAEVHAEQNADGPGGKYEPDRKDEPVPAKCVNTVAVGKRQASRKTKPQASSSAPAEPAAEEDADADEDVKQDEAVPVKTSDSASPTASDAKQASSQSSRGGARKKAGIEAAPVPIRASSRAASRAASQGIKASLAEEKEAAITRPKYPITTPNASSDPAAGPASEAPSAVSMKNTKPKDTKKLQVSDAAGDGSFNHTGAVISDEDANEEADGTVIEHDAEPQATTHTEGADLEVAGGKHKAASVIGKSRAAKSTSMKTQQAASVTNDEKPQRTTRGRPKLAQGNAQTSVAPAVGQANDVELPDAQAQPNSTSRRTTRSRIISNSSIVGADKTSSLSTSKTTRSQKASKRPAAGSEVGDKAEQKEEEPETEDEAPVKRPLARTPSAKSTSSAKETDATRSIAAAALDSNAPAATVAQHEAESESAKPLSESLAGNADMAATSTVSATSMLTNPSSATLLQSLKGLHISDVEYKLSVQGYLDLISKNHLADMESEGLRRIAEMNEQSQARRAELERVLKGR